jgi:ribosomal protein S18 acetylase RimI-like enzyme
MDFVGIQGVLPDHTVRAVTMDDVPALLDLVERLTSAVLGEPEVSESEMRDDLTGAHFDLARDTFIAVAPDGRATAYGQGRDEHTGTGWVDVYIDPALADELFDPLADAAIEAAARRVAESVRDRGESRVRLTANLYDTEVRMRAAYERAGIVVETVYWRLQRLFGPDEVLELPAVPNGFTVTKVDPRDDAIIEQAYHLFHETFSEHHGHDGRQEALADFIEDSRGTESFDPDAWWFAWRDTDPVGLLIGDDRRAEQGVGYVRAVGVQKQLRGRGIARALLLSAFADYQVRGRQGVQLGVDTGNTTGATRLYASVGMTSLHSAIALGRDIDV